MERPQLTDPSVLPSAEVLRDALTGSYQAYEEVIGIVTSSGYGLTHEWRYYNDGKAWLCKLVHKKKTVFWLSVWDGYFKIAFYITASHCQGIYDLDIVEDIKTELKSAKPIGKLYPVVLVISKKEQIGDLLRLVDYKMSII